MRTMRFSGLPGKPSSDQGARAGLWVPHLSVAGLRIVLKHCRSVLASMPRNDDALAPLLLLHSAVRSMPAAALRSCCAMRLPAWRAAI